MKILKKILVVLVVFIWSPSLVHAVDMGDIFSAETRTGSLTNSAQIDSFTFTAQIGQTVVINMSNETGYLNPMIDLISPSGILENSVNCGDDKSGTGTCVNITMNSHQLLESGIYTIVARDYAGNNTGDYSLSFLLIPGPTASFEDTTGGDVSSGETKVGAIHPKADTDAFTFLGASDQTVVINMSKEAGHLNPMIDLISPSGILENSVNCGDDKSGTGTCVNITMNSHQLLETGIYTIVVRDYAGNDTGDYSLSFSLIPNYSNQIPVLPETIQSYLILTNDSVPVTLPFGSYFEVYGSSGGNIVNVRMGARVQFQNFAGPNEINIEEASSRFTVHRSGTIVRLSSPAGTLIQIAAKQSAQTLRFADGSATLIINNNDVMIGDQFIHETEFELESPADTDDISVGKFW